MYWELTEREFQALRRQYEAKLRGQFEVDEYLTALLCANVRNAARTTNKQRVWKPRDFMTTHRKRRPQASEQYYKGKTQTLLDRLDSLANRMNDGTYQEKT